MFCMEKYIFLDKKKWQASSFKAKKENESFLVLTEEKWYQNKIFLYLK